MDYKDSHHKGYHSKNVQINRKQALLPYKLLIFVLFP